MALSRSGTAGVFLAAGFFGFTTPPVNSISSAHAHDFAQEIDRVELSAALMFLYAVGAIASPLLASGLIAVYGPGAMFIYIAAAHLGLVMFGVVRMRARRAVVARTEYVTVPRSSFLIGRLLGFERRR